MRPFLIIVIILPAFCLAKGQDTEQTPADSFVFIGQFSSWANFNPNNDLPLWIGARYIPQIDYNIQLPKTRLIDFELSANLNGNVGIQWTDTASANGKIKPYRIWTRYSTRQFELRLGLQKINFGSASLLRPLMWFDQIDPRDPLKLTDGVWSILSRYYFLNNANLWLWCLYGNKNPKGWETIRTNQKYPEVGGRFQFPVPHGETALSYHFRVADSHNTNPAIPTFSEIAENRIGFDTRLDLLVGCWFEGSWVSKAKDVGILTNQEILNLGVDYTFGMGNGLYVIFEQLVASFDENAFAFDNTVSFSLISLSYPVGLFDNLSTIVYFDWKNRVSYNFINWQKQFDKVTLYLMGYWNPKKYQIPTLDQGQNLYAGQGLQCMFVYNY